MRFRNRRQRVATRRFALSLSKEDALDAAEALDIDWDEVPFDPEDLLNGMKVELEHGTKVDERVNITNDDLVMTAQIAWAHLMEDPDYYILLDKMEKDFDGKRTPELREKEGRTMRTRFAGRKGTKPTAAQIKELIRILPNVDDENYNIYLEANLGMLSFGDFYGFVSLVSLQLYGVEDVRELSKAEALFCENAAQAVLDAMRAHWDANKVRILYKEILKYVK